MTIALCGLGNMGDAIASRLGHRFDVLGFDIDQATATASAERNGIRACGALGEVVAAGIVVLCLPSPAASIAVTSGLAPLLDRGSVIVETSTSNPADVLALAQICEPYGVRVIDAAIAAGVGQMRAGTAVLLVSGDDDAVTQAWEVLEAIGPKNIVRLGPELGRGSALKVINNAIAHAVMVVLVEAAAMAQACGIPRAQLLELLNGNDAGLTRPLEHRLMERVAQGNYDGGMPTEAARKDSVLALALAQSVGVPLFAIQGSHAVYEIATAEGQGRLDYASIAQLWEGWLGQSLPDSTAT
jgi:3-hydroxyisobutyrate dehydrogenase-like beta-hydroxyacid dehydrogenase